MFGFFRNGCMSVFLSIFLIVFGLMSIAVFYFYYLAMQSYNWTERDAKIEVLSLEKTKNQNKEKFYNKNGQYSDDQGRYDFKLKETVNNTLHLSYSYIFNDSIYHGKELWEGEGDGSHEKVAAQIYQKLKPAQSIRIWVNPKNPSDDAYAVRGITKELVQLQMLFIFITRVLFFFIFQNLEYFGSTNIFRKIFSWTFWTLFFISMFILKYSDYPFEPTANKIQIVAERYIPLPE